LGLNSMKKYPYVLQHDEEDCGAASLATVSQFYGRTFSINRIRETVGTGQAGTSLLGLKRGAEAIGFHTRGIKVSDDFLEKINEAPLPAIIHWKGYHWVVLYGKKGKKYVVADPAIGIRYLNEQELKAGWENGVMLLLLPDEINFYQQKSDKIGGFKRFLARVYPYRYILAEAIAINCGVGLLSLASPFLTQILTDDVLVRGDTQLLATVAIGVIAMNLFSSVITLVQSHLMGYFTQRLELGLILEYGRQLLRLPLSYFETRRSGEVISHLGDVNTINHLIQQIVLNLPSQFFVAIVSVGFMLFYSWQLSLASLAAFVVLTLVNLLFLPALRQKTKASIVLANENQGFLVETFRGVNVLKATQASRQAWEEYQQNFGRLAKLGWSTMKLEIYINTITNILSNLTNIGLLWLGSYLVINRTLTVGQLLAFNSMSGNFLEFLTSVVGLIDEFITAQFVIQRLTDVLDTKTEDQNDEKKPWVEIKKDTDIICHKLNFHHIGRVELLEDFSVTIPGGKVIALIGKSGCGKSTLAKIITGLYKSKSGNIKFGNYNQDDLSLECLRQQVVLVPQDAHFWSRSIIENFRFCYPQVNFEQIVQACQIAGADDFITQLPDKYQTVLGEFGANISGGQKQRLALARAIVSEPPILILDESTSALDPVGEAEVLDKLFFYRKEKTTIIISHRPRLIERADWIIYLENGKLKIQGTPQDLKAIPGEHLNFLTP
jgi:ABC-type bacteriocin/lantibiotic exporter with double-glycine peptidase domain